MTRGTIEFTNPARIDPFFDVEAQTRVRVPGQTYQVTVRAAGTMAHMQPELESDPPLPPADVLALLFLQTQPGNARATRAAEPQRHRWTPATRAAQTLANPISSQVGRVVEQTFGLDTFQLSPSLIDPYQQSATTSTYRVSPTARVTIGKQVSERLYLTFLRSLSSSFNDQRTRP